MTKLYTFVCALALAFLTSCQFSENIYINPEGAGTMEFSFDATELMKIAGENTSQSNERAIDSTFSFKEIFEAQSDSIAKLPEPERAALEEMKDFMVRMVVNPETNEMKFNLITEFNDANELQDMFSKMKKLQGLSGQNVQQNPMNNISNDNYTKLSYQYDGKIFKRKVEITDKELHQKMVDSLSETMAFYGSSSYKLNYHFPKPVKSVSNSKALFSDDKKTVTVEYDFADYLLNPEALNLEVILED